jgi:DNA-binding CsgD family transcriptional regulator
MDGLALAVQATSAGAGGVIVLEGAAGIGKTELLRSARELAASRDFVVCAGECDELDRVTPLSPLLTALRAATPPLVGAHHRGLWSAAEPMWAVEQLGVILERASARQPILVTVDDIQWADQISLLALSVLPARLFAVPVLWVLARRPYPASPQVQTLTERVTRAGGMVVPIGPLSREAATAIAADLLGAAPDRHLSGLIDQAAGNPFYLVELLSSLRHSQGVQVRGGVARLTARDMPEGFRAVITGHVRPLSGPSRRLVEVASVLGRQFSPTDVGALMGEPVGRMLGAIDEARAAEILVDAGDTLAFRHDLLRQAIYEQLPGSVRQALHRDAAAMLQARGGSWASVALHAAVGAVPGDEEAVGALERAAAELRGPNPGAAADLACRALDLRARDDPGRPAAAGQAVDMLAWAGRPDEAVPLAEQTLATGVADANLEATLLTGIRLSNLMGGGPTRDLPPLPARLLADPALAPALGRRLRLFDAFCRRFDDFDEAERVCAAVVAESEGAGDGVTLASARRMHTIFPLTNGDLLTTLREIEVAVSAADQGSPEEKRAVPRIDLGLTLFALDRLDDALETLGRALADAQLFGRSFIANIGAVRALVLLAAGRLDEALTEAESATIDSEDARMPYPPGETMRVQADVGLRRGDMNLVRTAVKNIAPMIALRGAYPAESFVLALAAQAEGRFQDAVAALAEPVSALAEGHFYIGVPNYDEMPCLVSLALQAGDRATADAVASAGASLADLNPAVPGMAGASAHASGLIDQSEPQLRRAVSLLAGGPRPLAAAKAMEDLAGLLEPRGDRSEIIDLYQSAYDIYDRCGATRDLAGVRTHLRRLGVVRRQPADKVLHGWASLSRAETAVVEVIAEGVTSQAAAERLYLSVNTVNTHLRHVFAKLGVRSRAELTRVVLSHRPSLGEVHPPGIPTVP